MKCPECGAYKYGSNRKYIRCPKCQSRMVSLYRCTHEKERERKKVRAAQNLSQQLSQKRYRQRNGAGT